MAVNSEGAIHFSVSQGLPSPQGLLGPQGLPGPMGPPGVSAHTQ